jgi:hypothetical protein
MNRNQSAKKLCKCIENTFGYDDDSSYKTMANDILEDMENGFTIWYHIENLMNELLPNSYHFKHNTICPFIRHIKTTIRVGFKGCSYDEISIYNIDAILALR